MRPIEALQQYWGYDAFRPLQLDIIQSVLDGKDTLALLPTGGGKSICFQVPALVQEGICIVVSPLIALMKDQVQHLKNRGIAAEAIYSGMHYKDIDRIFENAVNGGYKLLYMSPERLKTELAQERIRRMQVSLLAVDEAHCISQWGYDFRPSYLEIAEIRAIIPNTPVIALTATATTEVVTDIQERLLFSEKNLFQKSFERDNLSYSVLYEEQKEAKMLDIFKKIQGTGIVYVRNRGATKEVSRFLKKNGIAASFYHAGLSSDVRSQRQEDWIADKIRVMVCTNAFGMGIDKAVVRSVVHLGVPDSLEAYFQEAGRAGRDGKKSFAVLLYTKADAENLRFFLKNAYPPLSTLKQVYQALGNYTQVAIGAGLFEAFDFDFQDFCTVYHLDFTQTYSALRILEKEGWISVSDAAYIPAKATITAKRERLYDYQLRNPKADHIIKTLLRAYPGIQQQLANISEPYLAKFASRPIDEVRHILELLEQDGMLQYFPKKELPQLTFTHERIAANNLTIDQKAFNFRKKRAEARVEAAIRYAELHVCRSQQLLAYFGEEQAAVCGICDVCTGRHARDTDADTLQRYAQKIKIALKHEALQLPELLAAFSSAHQPKVSQALNVLLSEGRILQDKEGRIRWRKEE